MTELNLTKGERVDITKNNPGMTKLVIGGGWDINKAASGKSFDLDLSAFLLTNGKLAGNQDIVYFGAKKHASGSVELDKDNLTGEGAGDDEKIFVDLLKVPSTINEIVFAINIYKADEKGQNFGMVSNSFIRVVNAADNAQLAKYDPSEDFSTFTSLIAGKLYSKDGEWKFQAIGEGAKGTIADIAKKFA
jgi:tellurium resistance protein TerD